MSDKRLVPPPQTAGCAAGVEHKGFRWLSGPRAFRWLSGGFAVAVRWLCGPRAGSLASVLPLLGAVLADRAVRDGEGAVRHRDAGVQADLEQHLADLILGQAVAQRGLGVHGQLVLVLQGGEDGERDDGALR